MSAVETYKLTEPHAQYPAWCLLAWPVGAFKSGLIPIPEMDQDPSLRHAVLPEGMQMKLCLGRCWFWSAQPITYMDGWMDGRMDGWMDLESHREDQLHIITLYRKREMCFAGPASIILAGSPVTGHQLWAEDARHWQPWQLEGRNGIPKLAAKRPKETLPAKPRREMWTFVVKETIGNPTEVTMCMSMYLCFKSTSPWIKHLSTLSRSRSSLNSAARRSATKICVSWDPAAPWDDAADRPETGAFRNFQISFLNAIPIWLDAMRSSPSEPEGWRGDGWLPQSALSRDTEAVLPVGFSVRISILCIHFQMFQGHSRCTRQDCQGAIE